MQQIVCKCINRERNKQGKIIRYKLETTDGIVTTIAPWNLKQSIRYGAIQVTNLALTSDNKLILKD